MVLQIKQLLMMTKKKLLRFEKNDFCIYKFLSVRFNLLVAAAAPSIYNPTRIREFRVYEMEEDEEDEDVTVLLLLLILKAY